MINELFDGFDPDLNELYNYMANKIANKLKSSVVKSLGSGSFGKAYLLNDNKVLKITTSRHEVTESNKLIGKEYPITSTIYNVYQLKYKGLNKNEKIYAIILEYLSPLTEIQIKVYSKYLNKTERYVRAKCSKELFIKEIRPYCEQFNDPDSSLLCLIELYDLFKDLDKIGLFQSNDIHEYNMGIKNNNLAIYDITVGALTFPNIKNTLKIR